MGRQACTSEKLHPAFARAMKEFKREIRSISTPQSVSSLSTSIWITGSFSYFKSQVPTRMIPTPKEWVWKQTKKSVTIELDTITLTLKKLVPRRRRYISKEFELPPAYTLWEFSTNSSSELPSTMYWCEIGRNTSPEELNINDFYFLAEFMRPEVAASLWPLHSLLLPLHSNN